MKFLSTVFLSFFLLIGAHAKSYDECKTILEKCQDAHKTFEKHSSKATLDACSSVCESGVGHCNWVEPNGQDQSINGLLSQIAGSCGECQGWRTKARTGVVSCMPYKNSGSNSVGLLWGGKKVTCWRSIPPSSGDLFGCVPCGYRDWKQLNQLCDKTYKKCKGNCQAVPLI